MSCSPACKEATINGCNDILLKAGLTADTDYYVLLQKVNKTLVYQRRFTTNADGELLILKSSFPDGYFVTGSIIKLTLKKTDSSAQTFAFGVPAVEYDCVIIEVVNIDKAEDDISPTSTIQ